MPLSQRLRQRLRLIGVFGVAAIAGRFSLPAPPPRTLEGVAKLLGESMRGHVKPADLVWERNEGIFTEAMLGRNVLFLGAESPGGPRDVYRARVRVSLEGHPISVTSVHNLTSTPLGDDTALTADGPFAIRHAAFASTAYGAIAGVTLLDLEDDGGVVGAKNGFERLLGSLTNLFETGTTRGIGRVSFSFEAPSPSVRLAFEKGAFVLSPAQGAPFVYDLATSALREATPKDATPKEGEGERGVTVQPHPHLRKPPILWAVDTVRSVVGAGPIALLEDVFFGARDKMRQANHGLTGKAATTASSFKEDAPPPSPPLDASAAGDDGGYWPPSKLPSIWQEPEPEEGVWEPVTHAFLRAPALAPGVKEKPPAYFYTTWLKPDSKRPYSKVLVVAMDMRQLEVGMEGGVEDPKPLTGTKGSGRIPRDPSVLSRVVGSFNGAFKTTHGAYGMMVEKRVLLPPKPAAATVFVTDDHRLGMGAWPASETIPDMMVSFRQNLEPLVNDGVFNPTGRVQWGFQLAGTSVLTERSGICVTKPGHFFYLWGDDVSGATLGRAMVQAGCASGMHLDMNPKHTGFVFSAIRDVKKKDYDAKLLSPQMEIQPERYIEWSPKDFFYVMLRDTSTKPPSSETRESEASAAWSRDAGTQPAPAWLPAAHEAVISTGGVEVRVLGLDVGRVVYRVRAGQKEGAASADEPRDLPDDETKRVIAALGLGNGRKPRPLGLVLGAKVLAPHRGKMGYLALDAAGDLRIAAGEPPEGPTVVELPLVVSNGNVTTHAESQGPTRPRGAGCVLTNGRAAFAFSTASSDAPNATALAKLGCKIAVGFDRGGHEDSFVERAGKPGRAVARGEQTVLYAIATPMKPRAFAWKP